MPSFVETFDQGIAESKDPRDLARGEMVRAVGYEYRQGDPMRLYAQNGRTEFGDTGSAAKTTGLALLSYDSGGTDRLVAASGTVWYSATPGVKDTFSSLKTGLNSSATHLSKAHNNDRWYLANGYDRNQVVESDGTIYDMGMLAPDQAPVAAVSSASTTTTRPTALTAVSGTWNNGANAYDSDGDTFANTSLTGSGTAQATVGTWASKTASGRTMKIAWGLAGGQLFQQDPEGGGGGDPFFPGDTGGGIDAGYNVTVKIEVSEDSGSNYTTLLDRTQYYPSARDTIQFSVDDATDEANIIVRATLTYNSGVTQASLRLYDVRITEGSETTAFALSDKLHYCFTEIDSTRPFRESPPSEKVTITATTFGTSNRVDLTLPTSARNSTSTHFIVYKTTDGGTVPDGFFRAGEVKIGASNVFVDDFSELDKDTVGNKPLPLIPITVDNATLYFPRNGTPPVMRTIRSFKGSLVGLSIDNPRTLYYSIPGAAESWPEIYVITSFPFEDHDELVDCIEVGDTLVIGAKGLMMRLDRLPRVVHGVFDASDVTAIKGAPGLVGPKALEVISTKGEPLAVWISHYGIHLTNGMTFEDIHDDIDWTAIEAFNKTNWELHWDAKNQRLRFAYSTTGGTTNNSFYDLHFGNGNRKSDGRPKVTGPTPCAISAMDSGQVGGRQRWYSGHASNGKVYLEDNPDSGSDESNAYDTSSTLPKIVQGRKVVGGDRDVAALQGILRHTDFGGSADATMLWTAEKSFPQRSTTRTETFEMSGETSSIFGINRSGERHQFQLTYNGTGRGALLDLRVKARGLSEKGERRAVNG